MESISLCSSNIGAHDNLGAYPVDCMLSLVLNYYPISNSNSALIVLRPCLAC